MRWTLLAIFGAVLVAGGMVMLGLEIAHGDDIWQMHSGIGLVVLGGFCVWHGLAERQSAVENKPLWPLIVSLTILLVIGLILYHLAPPLAFLYLIIMGIIIRFSLIASWITRE